jgi:hypothetical protein
MTKSIDEKLVEKPFASTRQLQPLSSGRCSADVGYRWRARMAIG